MSELTPAAMPDDLDERLRRRDTSPLAKDVILRVQAINSGKSPVSNQRYEVRRSGEVFEGGHSADSNDWQTPFDQPLATTPARKLKAATMTKLRKLLREAFAGEAPYQADPTVEGGLFMVVTSRTTSGTHEVIYDAVRPPVLQQIIDLATAEE